MPPRPPKFEREYAKERYASIKAHGNFVENTAYPTNIFQFVAWFDARFGFHSHPTGSEVETEINYRNPLFYAGPLQLPPERKPYGASEGPKATAAAKAQEKAEEPETEGSKEKEERDEASPTLAERIHGSVYGRTRGGREAIEGFASRVGGPGRSGGSIAERVTGPFAGPLINRTQPKSLAQRIQDGMGRTNNKGAIQKTGGTGRKARKSSNQD